MHVSSKILRKMKKIYPDSGVELNPFVARHYDTVMNFASLGLYRKFIRKAIQDMNIMPDDTILDMGCGTGRNTLLMSDYLISGSITGMDISPLMEKQFGRKMKKEPKLKFINRRIDQQFNLGQTYSKVFISFVIHGLPHEIRETVIQNAYLHLKPGGSFFILDFAEFSMGKMPGLHRFIFKKIECTYAFDYIERDWKNILAANGFGNFSEHFYIKNYVRLLEAVKDEQ